MKNQRNRCLTQEEIKLLWDQIDTAYMSEPTKLALKLQLVTAQRKSEILAAEWHEINFDSQLWIIPQDKAKNGIEHRVPLSTLAIELLTKLKKMTGKSRWLFPS